MRRKPHLRWMIKSDHKRVLDIDNRIEGGWQKFRSEAELRSILGRRNCIGMVAELDGVVVGFMVYELIGRMLVVTRFAVDFDHRSVGFGNYLLAKLFAKLSRHRHTLRMLVPDDMLDAHLWLSRHGFTAHVEGMCYAFDWHWVEGTEPLLCALKESSSTP